MNELIAEQMQLEQQLDAVEAKYRRYYTGYMNLVNYVRFTCTGCESGSKTGMRNIIGMDKYRISNLAGMSEVVPVGHCISCILDGHRYMTVLKRLEDLDIELTERLNEINDILVLQS